MSAPDSEAEKFAALWRFRKTVDEEIAPALQRAAYRHGLLFTLTWKRTHPNRAPQMELAISWPVPRKARVPPNEG